jgi:mannose-6-phosphate isomerase-like protein (cupin superfamily)
MNAEQTNSDRSSQKARFIKLGPGEGLETRVKIAPIYLLKAGAAHTDGQYSVLEVSVNHDIPLHIHDTADELFFLLEGTLRVTFDDEQHEVGPGSFMFLPAGIPHAVRPVGETVPRLLQISVPGGFEHFIEDMVELQAKGKAMDLDSEEFREFSRKHDWTLLGSAGSADPNTDEPQAS